MDACSRIGRTICARPSSWKAERKAVLTALLFWFPSIDSDVQSISGSLRSPLIQIMADLLVIITRCLILLQKSRA